MLRSFFVSMSHRFDAGYDTGSQTLVYYCKMDVTVRSIEELEEVVGILTRYIMEGYKVILLSGELGSGKTTLTKALCTRLGVAEAITSPTFSLVNEYPSSGAGSIYHMDLYRLEKKEDLVQIGFEEYLESGQLCLIEWPEIADEHFYMPYIRVKISVGSNNIRIFNITTHDAVDT